MQEYHLQIWSP